MPSHAENIFMTAHNIGNRQASFLRHAGEDFLYSSQGVIDPRRLRIAETTISDLTQDIPFLADQIKESMKFSLDHNVGDAIVKMASTPMETVIKALPFAKLPHKKIWVEYITRGDTSRTGWLMQETKQGIVVCCSTSTKKMGHIPSFIVAPSTFLISKEGIHLLYAANIAPEAMPTITKALMTQAKDCINLLLLLNSRSQVLTVEEPQEDYTKINRAKRRNGKPEKPSLHTIKFDVARLVRKGLSATEAFADIAAALVRGHFKVRKTGVFFWSPFVRGAKSEEEKQVVWEAGLKRDRDVTITGPACLPS